ncbi:px domain containing protein [Diplodia corticola]|uniref:Px domain containing protein n=1 Tax=Diplodia corticola TaxID=236234 RepID=A0A1J9RUJ8_9PEZI|nr:px domain containing protein [Diplodia corticola]OJD36259.1 px domain containing protein [Diplodia corticola]
MAASPELSPAQAHALFDILTHQEVYGEIENFKWPDAIHRYGHPFRKDHAQPCTSPVLQSLLNKFALTLPGLSSVADVFWQERIQTIVEKLGAADLSESYDKGSVGLRKTLATAISALIEYPAKGALGGFPMKDVQPGRHYDMSSPDDVMHAWDAFLQQLVYGGMIDELFTKCAETDRIDQHSSLVQAAHEFILVNLASIMHHILVTSPDGQALLRILANIHKLIPYSIIRQTLRVGNAATMINGMVRLVLAKFSVGSLTNWVGLSRNADEGQNLLQSIISTVLAWDSSELQKQATKIEKLKEKERPSDGHLEAIKSHLQLTREEREKRRVKSRETPRSITAVIFEENNLSTDLPESHQHLAQEYFKAQLSIRDRDQLVQVLCRQQPDHLTEAIRDLVNAYDPIIRGVHNAVDLSAGLTDLENFLNDLIKIAKLPSPSKSKDRPKQQPLPTVEDFVKLLKKHQSSCHRFLHQIAKNGPEVTEWFREYALKFTSEFQGASDSPGGAGTMNSTLNSLFGKLSPEERGESLKALEAHSKYLTHLHESSAARMKSILSCSSRTEFGPGMYIAKWLELVGSTPITPATTNGPLRFGKNKDVQEAAQIDVDGERKGAALQKESKSDQAIPEAPEVENIVRLLGPEYRKVLAGGIA